MSTVNVALCCDDTYAQHVGVALCSALANLSRQSHARVSIVCSKFGRENRKKILSIAGTYNADVQFIEVNKKDFKGLKISHHISPATYFRIALPDLLPKELSKVLYIDSDLIVKDDLTKLYAVDISDAPLGAIAEADQGSPDIPRQTMGIPRDAVYFNSGVMLINLQKWRRDGLSQKLFDFIRKNPDRLRYWDQDALNIFFHNAFKPLHYRWNLSIQHIKKPALYDIKDIGILHFIGGHNDKPWSFDCTHPLKEEYYRYLNMTPWRGFKPKKPKPNKPIQQPHSFFVANGLKPYLNLGCGSRFHELWTNADLSPAHPSVIALNALSSMPFADNSFAVIYMCHVLEHIPKNQTVELLRECRRILQKDGIIRIVVPDLEQLALNYLACLKQGLEKPGDAHAKEEYEWALLELYDQCVRTSSRGDMEEYLGRPYLASEEALYRRAGNEMKSIRESLLKQPGVAAQASRLPDRSSASFRASWPVAMFYKLLCLSKKYRRIESIYNIGKFRLSGEVHQWMYDRYSLSLLLQEAGFSPARQESITPSARPDWNHYTLDRNSDGSEWKPVSLYMEASK